MPRSYTLALVGHRAMLAGGGDGGELFVSFTKAIDIYLTVHPGSLRERRMSQREK